MKKKLYSIIIITFLSCSFSIGCVSQKNAISPSSQNSSATKTDTFNMPSVGTSLKYIGCGYAVLYGIAALGLLMWGLGV